VLSALPVGLIATDGAGAVVWSNREGERLQAAVQPARLAAVAAGEGEHGGLALRVQRAPLPDGGTLVVVEDRSQVARLAREVDRLDRLAGLSELALGIAHEIKNPLNGVMGFAALLRRAPQAPQTERYLDKMLAGLDRIDGIVKAMLAFARPSDGRGSELPLADVVRQAAAEACVPMERIALHAAEGARASAALVRVLANLFRNSAEAAGASVAIDVRARREGGFLALTVADDGPGIPAAIAARIFEPFVSSKERGHGLGLALAARVMSYLGGSLELLDAGPPGARFRIRLPCAALEPAAAEAGR
jgi:signal transduction histidine kinase